MSYVVNGVELETGEENFLLEADFSEEVVGVIAAAEGIKLTDEHWMVVNYLRALPPISVICWLNLKSYTTALTGRKNCTNSFPINLRVRLVAYRG